MIIPYGDINPTERTPVVNWTLISLNVAVHVWVIFAVVKPAHVGLKDFYFQYGLVPGNPAPVNFFTSMFLHGSMMHLIGNMLYLYITGDNIEDQFGHFWFLMFYLFCGLVAAMSQILANPGSGTPMIGASGAISGVMGAYMILYPKSKIKILFWLGFFIFTALWDAIWWLGLWILFQIVQSHIAGGGGGGGVAYWAHIGGFLAGAGVAYICKLAGLTRDPARTRKNQGPWQPSDRSRGPGKPDDFWDGGGRNQKNQW